MYCVKRNGFSGIWQKETKASIGEPAKEDSGEPAEEHRNHADSVLPRMSLPSFPGMLPFSSDVFGVWTDSISALRIQKRVRTGIQALYQVSARRSLRLRSRAVNLFGIEGKELQNVGSV